ncbi:MAG: sigma 54-interacting transcriptional regulator [Candidatus Eisenbacteria bacterium]
MSLKPVAAPQPEPFEGPTELVPQRDATTLAAASILCGSLFEDVATSDAVERASPAADLDLERQADELEQRVATAAAPHGAGDVRSQLVRLHALALAHEDRPSLRVTGLALARSLLAAGCWTAAGEAFEALVPLARRGGEEEALLRIGEALAASGAGEPPRAVRHLARALRLLRGGGGPRSTPVHWALRGRARLTAANVYLDARDLPAARRMLDRLQGEPALERIPELRARARLAAARLLSLSGRLEAAESACRETIAVCREAAPACCEASAACREASAASVQADVPVCGGGAAMAEKGSWDEETGMQAASLLAEVLLERRMPAEARAVLSDVLPAGVDGARLAGAAYRFALAGLRRLAARLALQDGEEERAWAEFQWAEDLHRSVQASRELAGTLLERAEAVLVRRWEPNLREGAKESLLEARLLFHRLGESRFAWRCDVALEGLRECERAAAAAPAAAAARPPRVPRARRVSQLGFVTADPRILGALEPIESLARTAIPVLILGESGTGKEVLARALHRAAASRGPFVAVNCGALPAELQESELFGHVRGAFTGAIADKVGLFEAADGGTLLLDEIGEMTPRAQVKLLRVLELGEVRRVGETRTRKIHARVLAATNADLQGQIRRGEFRRDLYYRLSGLRIDLPPLRDRMGDVPLLVHHFVRLFAGPDDPRPSPTPEALDRLLAHAWPGNVRELRFVVEKALALTLALGRDRIEADCIDLERLPATIDAEEAFDPYDVSAAGGLEPFLENLERRLIVKALEENEWNRTRAARSLGGLSRTTLIGKMKRLGLFPGPGDSASAEEREPEGERIADPESAKPPASPSDGAGGDASRGCA